MSKRILVKESSFFDFIKSFFKAKSQGKEEKFIQTIKNYDPELADVWAKWNAASDKHLMSMKKYWLDKGNLKKAQDIQNIIDKYQ
jgi:hypothetical protein